MSVIHITKDNFKSEVLDSDKTVLIDFWASWCGPCRMLAPIIDKLADEHPEYKITKVNVDEQSELAGAFGIQSIPTLVVMKDGKPVNSAMGYMPYESVLALLESVR